MTTSGSRTASRTASRKRTARPTIEDVARVAGVSLGTVSNVLNARGNVSDERAAAVRKAIERLRYVPNGLAQSLRRQRSRVVGLCAPLTSSAYFAALLEAFEDIAASQGYEVMQVLSRQDPALELRRVDALLARKVDGLIVIPSADPHAAFDRIADSGVPAVIVDRLSDDRRFDYVTLDDYAAMAQATNALLERGHRRMLYVVRHPQLVTTRRRIEAFAATAGAVAGAHANVCVRDPDDAAFARQVASTLDGPRPPTAIIASNSALLLALLRVLHARGARVPDDVSLIAFDAPEWSDVLTPPLSVVRPPTQAIARTAWELLLARMEKPAGRRTRVALEAALELRESVRVLRVLRAPPRRAGRRS